MDACKRRHYFIWCTSITTGTSRVRVWMSRNDQIVKTNPQVSKVATLRAFKSIDTAFVVYQTETVVLRVERFWPKTNLQLLVEMICSWWYLVLVIIVYSWVDNTTRLFHGWCRGRGHSVVASTVRLRFGWTRVESRRFVCFCGQVRCLRYPETVT